MPAPLFDLSNNFCVLREKMAIVAENGGHAALIGCQTAIRIFSKPELCSALSCA